MKNLRNEVKADISSNQQHKRINPKEELADIKENDHSNSALGR
jgi:hypothetical protein